MKLSSLGLGGLGSLLSQATQKLGNDPAGTKLTENIQSLAKEIGKLDAFDPSDKEKLKPLLEKLHALIQQLIDILEGKKAPGAAGGAQGGGGGGGEGGGGGGGGGGGAGGAEGAGGGGGGGGGADAAGGAEGGGGAQGPAGADGAQGVSAVRSDNPKIQAALDQIAADPDGAKLLQAAAAKGLTSISVNPNLPGNTEGQFNHNGGAGKIEIKNPNSPDLIRTLVHELGHAATPENADSQAEERTVDNLGIAIQQRLTGRGPQWQLDAGSYSDLPQDNGIRAALRAIGIAA